MSTLDLYDRISLKAYYIWEQEGRPEGRDGVHWLRAERECLAAVEPKMKAANGVKVRASRANGAVPKKSVAPNDLMRIKGIGKAIAGKLNAIGVETVAQVASWTSEDVSDINQKLALRGRIQRGDWVAQAKTLVGGQ